MDILQERIEAQDLNQQGVMLLKVNNIEAARKKFDEAINLDPMLIDSYKNYGDLYMATGDYEDAKNSYKKALLIEKKGEIYFLYGNACFMKDEVHEGLENYNLALSSGFDNEEMLFFMGMAYEHLNDDQMALRYFRKACIKNPSKPDYMVKKISVLLRLNMIDSAEESIEELLKNSPELYDGYHIKTRLLLHKGLLDEAIEFSKYASERFPEDVDLLYDYARCNALAQKYDMAFQLIENAKKMQYYAASEHKLLLLEAQLAAENQDISRAVSCCEQCIMLEDVTGFNGEVRFMLMNLHLAENDYEKALSEAIKIVEKNTEDEYYYAALYYKPFCLKQMGNVEEAEKLYKEANSIYRLATFENPEAVDVYLYRVMCLKDLGNYDKALELIDFIEALGVEIAETHTLRADVYRALGNESQANEEMEKAYELKPELRLLNEGKDE